MVKNFTSGYRKPLKKQKKSSIYKAKCSGRTKPRSRFCGFWGRAPGFLPLKASEYQQKGGDGIREGTEIIVQAEKEERGNKGAAVTSTLANR